MKNHDKNECHDDNECHDNNKCHDNSDDSDNKSNDGGTIASFILCVPFGINYCFVYVYVITLVQFMIVLL